MSRKSIQDNVPAIREGLGLPFNIPLNYQGAALTTATNAIAQWTVPAALMPDHNGVAARLAAINIAVLAPGTGPTGGNWTFTITRSDGTVLGTAVIAYNATPLTASVDIRSATQIGPKTVIGDVISLNLTGVPTGTLGGATSIMASVLGEAYGIEA